MHNRVTDEQILEMRKLHDAGESHREIARIVGVSARTVSRKLGDPGSGSQFPLRKRRVVEQMINDGVPHKEISRSTGVSHVTIRKYFGPSKYALGELATFYNQVRRLEGGSSFAPFGQFAGSDDRV